jgi:hypothetical protein
MRGRSANAALQVMTERDDGILQIATDRFERRLAEENGKLRVEMANGFGTLRADMIDRNHELLKWMLVFLAMQLAAITALLALFR